MYVWWIIQKCVDYNVNVKGETLKLLEGKDDLAPKFINLKGKVSEFYFYKDSDFIRWHFQESEDTLKTGYLVIHIFMEEVILGIIKNYK